MMVIHRRWSSYLVTCQHERFSKAISHQLYTTSSRMDYLAGVLCFVFVDEVHQKEPETHIETFKKKHRHSQYYHWGSFLFLFF